MKATGLQTFSDEMQFYGRSALKVSFDTKDIKMSVENLSGYVEEEPVKKRACKKRCC